MKISTRARYGTRALLDLALHANGEPVLLKDIAERQEISLHYLEHLVTPLVTAGFVRSVRGVHGGVWLAKEPAKIKLSDVIQLYEGSFAPVECVDRPDVCKRSGACTTRGLWQEIKGAINGVLESFTLQDLVDRAKQESDSECKMYYI